MIKFCDTERFIELNKEIVQNPHANRAASDSIYDELDPKGTHLFDDKSILSRFGNTGFIRVAAYVKLKHRNEPHMITLDLVPDQWADLPTYTKELDKMVQSAKECSGCGEIRPHLPNDYKCIDCRAKRQ